MAIRLVGFHCGNVTMLLHSSNYFSPATAKVISKLSDEPSCFDHVNSNAHSPRREEKCTAGEKSLKQWELMRAYSIYLSPLQEKRVWLYFPWSLDASYQTATSRQKISISTRTRWQCALPQAHMILTDQERGTQTLHHATQSACTR